MEVRPGWPNCSLGAAPLTNENVRLRAAPYETIASYWCLSFFLREKKSRTGDIFCSLFFHASNHACHARVTCSPGQASPFAILLLPMDLLPRKVAWSCPHQGQRRTTVILLLTVPWYDLLFRLAIMKSSNIRIFLVGSNISMVSYKASFIRL